MSNGSNSFVKLSRKMLGWKWKTDPNTLALFIHCLLSASWCDTTYKGVEIKPGEFVTTLAELCEKTGLSPRQTRTALSKLKSTHELTSTSTNKNTLITVVNWGKYQGDKTARDKQNDTQSDKRATNEYTIYKKNIKNIKEENAFSAAPKAAKSERKRYSPTVIASAKEAGMTVEEYLKRVEELKNQ